MAVNFGRGIRLNSGMKVVGDAGGGGVVITPNSIVVTTITEYGYDWYGAYDYTTGYVNFGIPDFGTVTSDYFYAVLYQTNGLNTVQTNIALNDGNYTSFGFGFDVVNGAIDSDVQSYPRVFTIGGTNYTFTLSAQGYYFAYLDPLNLSGSVGSTITTVYNPAIQPSLTPNSIIVAQYVSGGFTTYYGANKTGPFGYGTIVSDYLTEVQYSSLATNIMLAPGTYTGFTVDSNGLIDGDNSTARTFTINGIDAVFTVAGSAPNYSYTNMGNPFSLNANVGNTLTAVYDPAAQGGGAGNSTPVLFNSGFLDTYNVGSEYGWRNGLFGNGNFAGYPSNLSGFWYDSVTNETYVDLITGNYSQNIYYSGMQYTTVTVITDTTINGYNVLQITDGNNVTATSTSAQNHTGGVRFVFVGDPWGLQAQGSFGSLYLNNISYLDDGSGFTPIASGTITVSNDGYSRYGWESSFGSSTFGGYGSAILSIVVDTAGGSGGTTGIYLMNGTYTGAVVDTTAGTVDGKTTITVTIDGVTELLTISGGQATVAGDPFGLQSKNAQTLNVLVVAGALAPAGQVASGTITVGVDGPSYGYSNGSGSPPFGSSAIAPAMVAFLAWINNGGSGSTGVRLTSGTYGSVVVDGSLGTVDGETQLTVVVDGISQTGTLSTAGGGGSYVELPPITGDPYGLQAKNGQTLPVSVIAGAGGGGGTTTYNSSGNWNYSNWQSSGGWHITLGLSSNPDSAMLTKLNALTSGSSITLSDGSNTQTVTVSYTSGQPWSNGSTVEIYTNTGSTTGSYATIASITL
jgi:hypothetical protein